MKQLIAIFIAGLVIFSSCEVSKSSTDQAQNVKESASSIENEMITDNAKFKIENEKPSLDQVEVTQVTDSKKKDEKLQSASPWEITALADYSQEDQVKVSFTNVSDKKVTVFNPLRKKVERLENDSWRPIEIVYCNCRPCPAPPETKEVSSGKIYTIRWSKKEDSCDNGQFNQADCHSGIYRISIQYDLNGNKTLEVVEFKI